MFVEMSVPTAQTAPFTLIAGLAKNMAHVISTDSLEVYGTKITSVSTRQPTLPFAALLP